MALTTIDTGLHWVETPCPKCGAIEIVAMHLDAILQIPTEDAPSLRVRARSKPVDHSCGQTSLTLTTADMLPGAE